MLAGFLIRDRGALSLDGIPGLSDLPPGWAFCFGHHTKFDDADRHHPDADPAHPSACSILTEADLRPVSRRLTQLARPDRPELPLPA